MSTEEIKLWAVDNAGGAVPVQPADAMESESLLETTLVAHPELLERGLKLVGRQTATEGGPLDLLGVDEDGRLVVFELKRGTLSRDAVAQVIDYASSLDSLTDGDLAKLISERSGNLDIDKIDDFEDWYGRHGAGEGLESLRPIRTVLVGLGVDDTTERMVNFLAKNGGMNISLLTFHGFTHENKTFLARQSRVERSGRRPRRVDREANREGLLERAGQWGITELFEEANDIFRKQWEGPQERARTYGLGFRLSGLQRSGKLARRIYARVIPVPDGLWIQFFNRAVELCTDKFREALTEIDFDTYPAGQKENPFQAGIDIRFKLTANNWESYKNRISGLASAVYENLGRPNEIDSNNNMGPAEDDEYDGE